MKNPKRVAAGKRVYERFGGMPYEMVLKQCQICGKITRIERSKDYCPKCVDKVVKDIMDKL